MARGGGSGDASRKIDYLFKVVLSGTTRVGKSKIPDRFLRNEFNSISRTTVGVEFGSRTFIIQDLSVKAQIWDTAGQQRYRAIESAYYRDAVGVMLVYDITNRQTFNDIGMWLQEARDYVDENTVIILVGNKSDMEDQRSVPTEEAKEYAQKEGLLFQEVSARESTNVESAFLTFITEIFKIKNNESMVAGDEHDGNMGCLAGFLYR